jgi:hypothetical protein
MRREPRQGAPERDMETRQNTATAARAKFAVCERVHRRGNVTICCGSAAADHGEGRQQAFPGHAANAILSVPRQNDYGTSMSLSRLARRLSAPLAALALILLPVLLAGCNLKSGGFVITTPAHLRFFNALVDGGPISATLGTNQTTILAGLPFEGLTGYIDISAGNQELKIVANGTSTISDATTLFIDDSSYTYLIYGTSAAPTVLQVSDTATVTPDSGQFFLRVINAAYGSAGIDVYVTAPGASLDNMSPNVSNLAYNSTSLFSVFSSGGYQVRFTVPNSKQVIYDAGSLTFAEKTSYQLVAYTKGSSTLVNGALLTLDTSGTGNVVNNRFAQFKLIHAAPGTTAINALLDGTQVLANIPYQGASSYEALAAGAHTLTIETVAAPGAVIASAQPPFAAATDTSIVVTGTPGAQTAVVFPDTNLPGTEGTARIRFVNVAPNVGPVDVYVNFAPQASGVATNAASGYVALAENTYAITFDVAGTTTLLLNLPAIALTSGRTYTLYLVGTSGALAGVLTRDD